MKNRMCTGTEVAVVGLSDVLSELPLAEMAALPAPSTLMYYLDRNDRMSWLEGDVDEDVLSLEKQILYFNRCDAGIPPAERKPIKLLIYSYGGDGVASFSLIDVILNSQTPIYTINMGVAMSAALVILLAGHKRYCLPRSVALIHSGSGGTNGTYEQNEAQMKDYQHFVGVMRDFILERTSITAKTFNKQKGKEWYLYAADQVSHHVVDAVINSLDEINP